MLCHQLQVCWLCCSLFVHERVQFTLLSIASTLDCFGMGFCEQRAPHVDSRLNTARSNVRAICIPGHRWSMSRITSMGDALVLRLEINRKISIWCVNNESSA